MTALKDMPHLLPALPGGMAFPALSPDEPDEPGVSGVSGASGASGEPGASTSRQTRLRVKVCGLTRQEDAAGCARLGVHLGGFIFHASSPRNVDPAYVADMDTGRMLRVGVFVRQSVDEVVRTMRVARLHMAQLHGGQDVAFCKELVAALADILPEVLSGMSPSSGGEHADSPHDMARGRLLRAVWPARHPTTVSFEHELATLAPYVGHFVFDAGTAGGGHGATLPWDALEGLSCPRPWLLAGGLGPDNVERAVRACHPWGGDLNSGVESAPGIKDMQRIENALVALAACGDVSGPEARIGDARS